ncbi:MAG: glycosyltransferase family A protein [Eubacteriales bacterium]|nr:glycosyltransferase family A protein [Eubacteriales bacterium]
MIRPTVSVIIPIFNGEKYIRQTIESIIAQDHDSCEIIVVDDGSTDTTGDIISEFPHIRYFRQENKGVAAARNSGIQKAFGDYLAFIDADDLWDSAKLSKQLAFMVEHPQIGYTFTRHTLFLSEDMEAMPDWVRPDYAEAELTAYIPSSMMIKRDVFIRIGYFDESFVLSEDSDWFMRARDLGIQMAVIPENLLLKRIHSANLSGDTLKTQNSLMRAIKNSIVRNKKKGKISVIIPVHNGEKYLSEAIDSVLAQTLRPYEIIVVNDGSIDKTEDICKGYGDKIRYASQENKGAASARNTGIKLAEGEYLSFLDADDLWSESRLSQGMEAMKKDPSIAMTFGMVAEFYSPETDEAFRDRYKCQRIPLKGIHPGTLLIRKDDMMRVGLFDETFRTGEFLDWFNRANDMGLKYLMTDQIQMRRRIHYTNHGITQQSSKEDYLRIVKERLMKRKGGKSDENR